MPVKDFILLVVYLLVLLASNFIKRGNSCHLICKVLDHKPR